MNEKRPDFRDALATLTAETRARAPGRAEEHPDAGQWLAYHRGELPAEQDEAFQEHLVGCRECADLLLAVGAFAAEPAPDTDAFDELSTAASWRLLAPRLDDEEAAREAARGTAAVLAAAPAASPSGTALPRWSWALAASLLAAVVGLGAWNLEQHRRLSELARPQPNARFVYLAPRERAEPTPATAVAGVPLALILYPEAPHAGALYRVTIVDVSGPRERPRETLDGLVPDEDLAVTLLLPAGLPPGRFRIDLSPMGGGPQGELAEDIQSYDLEVAGAGGAGAPETPG